MLSRKLQAVAASWLANFGLTLCLDAQPFSEYIYTPRSRTLVPRSVYNVNGSVAYAAALTSSGTPGTATFNGASSVTYDFGKNVGGIVSFHTSNVTGSNETIGITFSESNLYISSLGSDLTGIKHGTLDRPLVWKVSPWSEYGADKGHVRGGFRYLSIFHNGTGSVGITNVTVHLTAVPQIPESTLGKHYTGYFHSNNEKLNRVWYAGAYTIELCTIDATTGNGMLGLYNPDSEEWISNVTITNGSTALVDGAKRDRVIWPGDLAVEMSTMFVSTYLLDTIEASMDSFLVLQLENGCLPYNGQPLWQVLGRPFSFTYHLHGLLAIRSHFLWTGDVAYLKKNWPIFKLGLNCSLSFVDTTGMANVTSPNDWLRVGMGGHNIEANAILYYVLNQAVKLAEVLDDKGHVATWTTQAEALKTAANDKLWDAKANLYRDNDTAPLTSLHPQDGNAWSIVANLTTSDTQRLAVSKALQARWTPYGPPAPEAGAATVSPYVSGFELQAHYEVGAASTAVALIESMWADFMLDDPRMTNSTFIEGYSTDGSLHYEPYQDDVRVNFAHGWSTGPTSALTMYAAGLRVVEAGGKQWLVSPSLGGLTELQAGFRTAVGDFSVAISAPQGSSGSMQMNFSTPAGTSGSVSVERPPHGGSLTIEGPTARTVTIPVGSSRFQVDGLGGGHYQVAVTAHAAVPDTRLLSRAPRDIRLYMNRWLGTLFGETTRVELRIGNKRTASAPIEESNRQVQIEF